jgi:beta-galactosidase
MDWCGFDLPRVWRCGNRGDVASALIEKPASGDFLPILDGGFSLQYASLMEYLEGRGMVIFCQTDVTGRTESDPAAEALARNIVRYVSSWKPAPRRTVVYVGEEAGLKYLQSEGISPAAYAGNLSADQVLVVGPGGGPQLAANAAAVKDWVRAGGHVLALGLTGEEASAFLPSAVTTTPGEHIAAYFDAFGPDSPLAGVCPADVHSRDPRTLPLVSGGATVVGDGVLGAVAGENVVFCQLPPWQLDYSGEKMNIKRTFRKLSFCTTRLLANMGAAGQTKLLQDVSKPLEVHVDPLAEFRGKMRIERGGRAVVLPGRWQGLALVTGEEPAGWANPGFDDAAWRAIDVPGAWEDQFADLAAFDGTFLYRVKVTVPAEIAQGEAVLVLGAVDDEDRTYVNGKLVGSITKETNPKDYWQAVRSYTIPAGTLVAGENVIAVAANDIYQSGGIMCFLNEPDPTAPPAQTEQRWLDGLYLDVPQEWDDPYRFFRW